MLIAGVRQKVKSELDTRHSASFMRYLMHFLQMFAFLGIIIPILASVDYFLPPETIDEVVINKYYDPASIHTKYTEYQFITASYSFRSDITFYQNINIGDKVTYLFTPIFKTATNVIFNTRNIEYKCGFTNIYDWKFIIIVVTFLTSTFVVLKTRGWLRKKRNIKHNIITNIAIVNVFLCLMTLVAVLFHLN